MEWHDENELIRKRDAVEAVINMADTLDDVVGILLAVPELTGKWKRTERDIGENYPEIVWTCTTCGEYTSVRGYKKCPHCGSRNEEE